MYRVPRVAEPPARIWRYVIAYGALYVVGNGIVFCKQVAVDDSCSGAGASFPGGCPEYSRGADIQLAFFGLGGLALMAGLIWLISARPLSKRTRSLVLIGYALFMLFGPLIFLVPPPPR